MFQCNSTVKESGPLHFPSKMVKSTKPAAKPRKTARPEDDEEPDPTPKRSRTAPKTPVTVQDEESNLGRSPIDKNPTSIKGFLGAAGFLVQAYEKAHLSTKICPPNAILVPHSLWGI
eukprot:SAG11_NODE_63_length_18904_cov_11.842914_1_plen_117_part_00